MQVANRNKPGIAARLDVANRKRPTCANKNTAWFKRMLIQIFCQLLVLFLFLSPSQGSPALPGTLPGRHFMISTAHEVKK